MKKKLKQTLIAEFGIHFQGCMDEFEFMMQDINPYIDMAYWEGAQFGVLITVALLLIVFIFTNNY